MNNFELVDFFFGCVCVHLGCLAVENNVYNA